MKIDIKKCKLCGTCVEGCSQDAIEPARDIKTDKPYYKINTKKCSECKVCISLCEHSAVTE